mgnify:FL=1|tara:strand:- start:277 stop:480 length:204 start_codon:yes stop_codon:yes gene_type:complete
MANIFSTPKELKTWAIKLANACGGQKVEKSQILTQLNANRVDELIAEFEQSYNEQLVKGQVNKQEEE